MLILGEGYFVGFRDRYESWGGGVRSFQIDIGDVNIIRGRGPVAEIGNVNI